MERVAETSGPASTSIEHDVRSYTARRPVAKPGWMRPKRRVYVWPVHIGDDAPEPPTLRAPPPVTWAETRRDLLADLAVYGLWFPVLPETVPAWLRCAHAAFRADMFGANVLYRVQVFLAGTRARVVATWLSRCSRILFGVTISSLARIGGGFYIAHGHIVVEGVTTIGRRASVAPFVTIGLTSRRDGMIEFRGATIGDDVVIGTGAKVIGPVRIGDRARIGANAVVVSDVADDQAAVGIPARAAGSRP